MSTNNMPPTSLSFGSASLSQAEPQLPSQPTSLSKVKQYRPPRALPFELSQHVLIYFEETLYTQALNLLISLLSSSSASRDPHAPAFVPSPNHLSLAATLAIHPTLTTRTASREKHEQANAAFRLLRLTNTIVGPVGADFRVAFAFRRFDAKASWLSGRRNGGDSGDTDSPRGEEKIDTPFSGKESLWSRAEDFWHLLGWALNCSCLKSTPVYARRWERWSLLLEYMLQVLEDDWAVWFAAGQCQRSLIWQYIDTASGGYGKNRRILRAIFADGNEKAMNEFKDVFSNELKEPTKDSEKVKKREVDVNVEAEIYGDYMAKDDDDDDDDDDISDEDIVPNPAKSTRTRDPSTRRVTPRTSTASLRGEYESHEPDGAGGGAGTMGGGRESLSLRLRLLELLSGLAHQMPDEFMAVGELFTLFVEFIRPLPLSAFQLVVLPSTCCDAFSENSHITLCELLLQRMLESVAPGTRQDRFVTQRKMEQFYLPYAASKSTHVENAKVSLLLESMLRYFSIAGTLRPRPGLREALEAGVAARHDKVASGPKKGTKAGGGGGDGDGVAWAWLKESGERMRDIVSRLEEGGHVPP